jgi:hypothetical protein
VGVKWDGVGRLRAPSGRLRDAAMRAHRDPEGAAAAWLFRSTVNRTPSLVGSAGRVTRTSAVPFSGPSATCAAATSNSRTNPAAALKLRSSYHAVALRSSSSAAEWNLTLFIQERVKLRAHLFPWDRPHLSRIELAHSSFHLSSPCCLDIFVRLTVKALQQPARQTGAVRFRKSGRFLQQFRDVTGHGAILPLSLPQARSSHTQESDVRETRWCDPERNTPGYFSVSKASGNSPCPGPRSFSSRATTRMVWPDFTPRER